MTTPFPGQTPGQHQPATPGDVPQNVPSRAELRARRTGASSSGTPQQAPASTRQGQPGPQRQPLAQRSAPQPSAPQPSAPRPSAPQPPTGQRSASSPQPPESGGPLLPWVSPTTGKAPSPAIASNRVIASSPPRAESGGSGSGGSNGSGNGNGKGGNGGRKKKQVRALLAIVASLVVVAFGANFVMNQLGGDDGATTQTAPSADYPGPGEGSVMVTIPDGASGATMANILTEADVVSGPDVFIQAFNQNPNAVGIQPGTYEMLEQMNSADAVQLLLEDSARVDRTITFPEGYTVTQIVTRLSNGLGIPEEEFYAALDDPDSIGLPEEAGGNPEGWLHASQYRFPQETTATQALTYMVRKTESMLDGLGVPDEDRQEVLIKASLIEREARHDDDRPKVARAIENRLETPMNLQIDASLAYGLDKSGMDLTRADMEIDNPYNLEMHSGLPPTPIASPNQLSVEAVLDPEPGDWIFWVTVNLDTGETKFSDNYTQHQQYVAELREWQRENGLRD